MKFLTKNLLVEGEASNWTPPTATGSTLVRDHHHELEDDHAHHHKKSVLTKVKEKAKKLRHSLSNKKKHNESTNTTSSWSVRLNEDDQEEEEDDAEYLGAPSIYYQSILSSTLITISYFYFYFPSKFNLYQLIYILLNLKQNPPILANVSIQVNIVESNIA